MDLPPPQVRVFRPKATGLVRRHRLRPLPPPRPVPLPRDRPQPRRAPLPVRRTSPVERPERDPAVLRRGGQPVALPESQQVQPAPNLFVHRSIPRPQPGHPLPAGGEPDDPHRPLSPASGGAAGSPLPSPLGARPVGRSVWTISPWSPTATGARQDNNSNRSQAGSVSVVAASRAKPMPADPLRNEASSTKPCPPSTSAQAWKPPTPTPGLR